MTGWEVRHYSAMLQPIDAEVPVVTLLQTAYDLAEEHGQDYALREAVVHACKAVRVLLDGNLGRLDGGSLSEEIEALMERVSFDSDTDRYTDG